MIISVEGNIGVGKTTLLSQLQKYTDFTVYPENVNNWTYLNKFYRDPQTYAFLLQEEILLDIKNKRTLAQNIITERCAQTSVEVFTKISMECGYINQKQLEKLRLIEQTIPRPTAFIYLKLDVNQLLPRIQKRGRESEKSISVEYLKQVEEKQELFLAGRSEPVLVLDANNATSLLLEESLLFIKKCRAQTAANRILN